MSTVRTNAAAGIIIDQYTTERYVIFTGGSNEYENNGMDSTEILFENQWSNGEFIKKILNLLDSRLLVIPIKSQNSTFLGQRGPVSSKSHIIAGFDRCAI